MRELIKNNHIAPGEVDERSIKDVVPAELVGFTQCHFFAGIAAWSYALRLAGWPDDKPVWTGSCPCQPFSDAGGKAGFADERHLWPHWFHLISQCRPSTIFGEQVASKDARAWLDLVFNDLEASNYACGAINFPACGIGAPHIRQRLWFLAHTMRAGRAKGGAKSGDRPIAGPSSFGSLANPGGHGAGEHFGKLSGHESKHEIGPPLVDNPPVDSRPIGELDNAHGEGFKGRPEHAAREGQSPSLPGAASIVAHAPGEQCDEGRIGAEGIQPRSELGSARHGIAAWRAHEKSCLPAPFSGAVKGHWGDADWLLCRDGKWRPVESGTFPLASGAPARVGRLRGYGNAINAAAAKEIIAAYMEIEDSK